jgi:plastocyanin
MLDGTIRRTALAAIIAGSAALAISTLGGCRSGISVDPSLGSEELTPSYTGAHLPPDDRGAPAARAAAPARVSIDNFSFAPAELTVAVGQPVIWDNRDDVPHTIVATNREFSSAALDTDQTFTHAFSSPGTYVYFCGIHPHMTGRITVK